MLLSFGGALAGANVVLCIGFKKGKKKLSMLLLPWCNLQMKTLRTVMLKEVRNMGHSSCFYFQCDSPTRER